MNTNQVPDYEIIMEERDYRVVEIEPEKILKDLNSNVFYDEGSPDKSIRELCKENSECSNHESWKGVRDTVRLYNLMRIQHIRNTGNAKKAAREAMNTLISRRNLQQSIIGEIPGDTSLIFTVIFSSLILFKSCSFDANRVDSRDVLYFS